MASNQLRSEKVRLYVLVCGALMVTAVAVFGVLEPNSHAGLGWRTALVALGGALVGIGILFTYRESSKEASAVRQDGRHGYLYDSAGNPPSVRRSWYLKISPFIFLGTLLFAMGLDFEVLPMVRQSTLKELFGHLVIAFLIASILGLTYEWLLSNKREEGILKLLTTHNAHIEATLEQLLKAYAAASPELVLRLIRDIAAQTKQTPTLYRPPRDGNNEYTFANNVEYFRSLITLRRSECCEVIREWLQEGDCPDNIKFLASDFVGEFELQELAGDLQREVRVQRSRWDEITDDKKKAWVLNYIWAYSRFETPRYKSLGEFLRGNADEWAQAGFCSYRFKWLTRSSDPLSIRTFVVLSLFPKLILPRR